ncbi:MAG: hypothetical protein QM658_10120 [Gordonia sp. (in: high G+C Gram-positive bacteria)]
MSQFTRRAAGVLAAGSAALLLLSGCSGGGDAVKAHDASTRASSTTTTSDDTKPGVTDGSKAPTLVVDQSVFPAGYTVQEIPAGQLKTTVDQMLAAVKGLRSDPASCVQQNLIPDSVDLGSLGLVVGTRNGGTSNLAEAVTVGGLSIDKQRKSVSGNCQTVSVSFDSGPAKGASGTVTSVIVPAPKTKAKASDVLVVARTTDMALNGQHVTTRSKQGFAQVNGYTVSVQSTSPTGGAVDEAGFERLFVAAVNKVADEG